MYLLWLLLFPFSLLELLGTTQRKLKYIYTAVESLLGSGKFLRNLCQVCKNVAETDTFQSFVDKKVHKNNHRFTYSDKCLVHLLSCNVFQRQYNGRTVNESRYRWDNYKNNNRKSLKVDDHNQAGIFANFQNLDHKGFLEDTEIAFIDKTNPSNFTRPEVFGLIRQKLVFHWGFIIQTHITGCICIFLSH